MSCVIGLVDKGDIYIASDSRASVEDNIRPIIAKKIYRTGKFLFGAVGNARSCQLLDSHYFKPPKHILDLPDAVRELCRGKGCLTALDEQPEAWLSNLIVAVDDKLYEMLIDFHINEVEKFTAIGSGSNYALGSLMTTQELNINPIKRINLALESAQEFDSSTGGVFTIEKL